MIFLGCSKLKASQPVNYFSWYFDKNIENCTQWITLVYLTGLFHLFMNLSGSAFFCFFCLSSPFHMFYFWVNALRCHCITYQKLPLLQRLESFFMLPFHQTCIWMFCPSRFYHAPFMFRYFCVKFVVKYFFVHHLLFTCSTCEFMLCVVTVLHIRNYPCFSDWNLFLCCLFIKPAFGCFVPVGFIILLLCLDIFV